MTRQDPPPKYNPNPGPNHEPNLGPNHEPNPVQRRIESDLVVSLRSSIGLWLGKSWVNTRTQ